MATVDSVTCPHCGTLDNPAVEGLADRFNMNPDTGGQQNNSLYKALGFKCCRRRALVYVWDGNITHMWPTPLPVKAPKHVPAAVTSDFTEAATCLANNLPRACAMMARRTIEAACEEKGCKVSRNLPASIEKLQTAGHILPYMQQAATKIKLLGDEAAHEIGFKDTAPPHEELERVLRFVHALLTALYETPTEADLLLNGNGDAPPP